MIRSTVSITLIFCMLAISIGNWEFGINFMELNEEIEQVIEDSSMKDLINIEDLSDDHSDSAILKSYCQHHADEYAQGSDHFEIDSPPPEFC